MTTKHLCALFCALTLVTGCASETHVEEPLDFARFRVDMQVDGATVEPDSAMTSWSDSSISAWNRALDDDGTTSDWLNVNRYDRAPLELEPGMVIVDGPAVDDRGTRADYVADDDYTYPGELDARPWLDFERCEPLGGGEAGDFDCAAADVIRIEVRAIEGEPDHLELRYTATFHEDDRVFSGTMVTAYQPTDIGQMRGPQG